MNTTNEKKVRSNKFYFRSNRSYNEVGGEIWKCGNIWGNDGCIQNEGMGVCMRPIK